MDSAIRLNCAEQNFLVHQKQTETGNTVSNK